MANVKLRDKPIDRAGADLHHRISDCHVLVLGADLSQDIKRELIDLSESGRFFFNRLRPILIGRLKNLFQNHTYCNLCYENQCIKCPIRKMPERN